MEGNEQLAIIIPKLRTVAAAIDGGQLAAPTPCADFTVAGVLAHMTGLAGTFAPMFRGEAPPDEASVTSDAGEVAQFDSAMGALLDAVQSPGALERVMQTPGGPMPGAVFARLVAFDGVVHGWDLASSTGQDWQLPDALVTEVDGFARQAITSEMRDGGVFAAEEQPPTGATPIQRLVAFSGRAV